MSQQSATWSTAPAKAGEFGRGGGDRRRTVLAITDSEETSGQIVRAIWRSGVDVLTIGPSAPPAAIAEAARLEPDVIIAELADDHRPVAETVRQLRRSSRAFTPALVLHRTGGPAQSPTHTYADSHLVEPFSLEQILTEVEFLLYPGTDPAAEWIYRIDDLELNTVSREVTRDGSVIELTRLEFDLLRFLLRNVGTALSRGRILDHVWDHASSRTDKIVDVYVAQLRRKIGRPGSPVIRTVRGVGYALRPTAAPLVALNAS
jgi:two-component system response regulator TrcR